MIFLIIIFLDKILLDKHANNIKDSVTVLGPIAQLEEPPAHNR